MSEKIPAEHGEQGRTRSESIPPLDEKGEGLRTVDAGLSADQVVADYDEAETRRIMRKIDYRLIPLLAVLYLQVDSWTPVVDVLTASTDWPTSTAAILGMQRLQAWKKTST